MGGRLSERAFDNGQGILTIENVRPEDQGTYSCTGSNPKAIDMNEGVLTVSGWNYFFDRFVFYCFKTFIFDNKKLYFGFILTFRINFIFVQFKIKISNSS